MGDLGVNLAGIEVILRILERMAELQNRLEETEAELRSLREVDDV